MQPDGSTPYGSQAAPRPDLLAVATRARHVVNTLANADMRLCSPPCPGPRCVFYYSGAASRAGLSYSGAILASSDGQWPTLQVGWGAHAGWPSWVAFSSGCLPLGRAQAPLQTGQQACTSLIHRDLQDAGWELPKSGVQQSLFHIFCLAARRVHSSALRRRFRQPAFGPGSCPQWTTPTVLVLLWILPSWHWPEIALHA